MSNMLRTMTMTRASGKTAKISSRWANRLGILRPPLIPQLTTALGPRRSMD